jgi:hypothetical protein
MNSPSNRRHTSEEEREQHASLRVGSPNGNRAQIEDTKGGRVLHAIFIVIFLPVLFFLTMIHLRDEARDVLNHTLPMHSRMFSALSGVFMAVWCCFLVLLLLRSSRRTVGRLRTSSPMEPCNR